MPNPASIVIPALPVPAHFKLIIINLDILRIQHSTNSHFTNRAWTCI